MTDNDVTPRIVEFLERFTAAMGIAGKVKVEQRVEGPRINLDGEEAERILKIDSIERTTARLSGSDDEPSSSGVPANDEFP